MNDRIQELAAIQDRLRGACVDSETIRLALESGGSCPDRLERLLELAEDAAVRLRNLTETLRTPREVSLPDGQFRTWSGRIEVTAEGWIHLELSGLLPSCRYRTPRLLTDTLARLLAGYRAAGGVLPFFERAALVIDEHCNLESRQVFDQDNKGWKAIPNAFKGVTLRDDDQFSLHLCLLSTPSPKPVCHIYLLAQEELEAFFSVRNGQEIVNRR